VILYRSEASASLRRIPLWLVTSNGTSPATGESGGQPQVYWLARNLLANTAATLSAVSANAGEYYCELSASEVSQLGGGELQYRSGTALQNATYFQIVNFDSGDSMRLGQLSLPNASAEAAGGIVTFGTGAGQLHTSGGSIALKAQIHSQATIQGELDPTPFWNASRSSYSLPTGFGAASQVVSVGTFQNGSTVTATLASAETTTDSFYNGCLAMVQYADGARAGALISAYSGSNRSVTFVAALPVTLASGLSYILYPGVDASLALSIWSSYVTRSITSIAAGTFSGVTIQGLSNYANISNVTLAAGTHSNVTIQGVTRVNSSVTPANALYSAVTVRLDVVTYSGATLGVNNIGPGTYSGATLGINNIAPGAYSGVTVDGAKFLSVAGERSVASSWMSTNLGNSRFAQDSLFVLRNRVQISGSTMTVYHPDDTTSSWTASVTTGANPLSGIDPAG
jgi:hypothetical protein